MGLEYACADCGVTAGLAIPHVCLVGYIVYFGGKENTDADIASYFGDLFHFAAETTIWNARRAACWSRP